MNKKITLRENILRELNSKLKLSGYIAHQNMTSSFNGIIDENSYDLYVTKEKEYFDVGIKLRGCNNVSISTRINKPKTPRGVFYPVSKKLNGTVSPTDAIAKFNDQYICAGFEIRENGNTIYENVNNVIKIVDTAYKHIQKFDIKKRETSVPQGKLELKLE